MNTSTANTSVEDRALELLSSGIEEVHVASALGVSPSRISQLLAQPLFASRLSEKRYVALQKHNITDNKLDALESKVIDKLDKTIDMVYDPMKLAIVLTRINSAKRRGASAPESLIRQRPTVRLNMNTAIIARFAVNGANQVVEATVGSQSQELVTIQSGNVQKLLNEHTKAIAETQMKVLGSEESNGKVWNKPQGREKVDLLTELGFAHEITISSSESSDS